MEEQHNQKPSNRWANSRVWPAFIFGVILPSLFFILIGTNLYIGLMGILGLTFSILWLIFSFKTSKRRWFKLGIVIISLVSSIIFISRTIIPFTSNSIQFAAQKKTYAGSSDGLKHTLVVSTLESVIPDGNNIIWCSSFQLAWNALADKLRGSYIILNGNDEIARQLNNSLCSGNDIESRSYYAGAGYVRDGIIQEIQKNMIAKFPQKAVPDFSDDVTEEAYLMAYAYITANVKFDIPFRKNNNKFVFKGSNNDGTDVESFGLWEGFLPNYRKMREQVEVLYYYHLPDTNNHRREMSEYALDLCKSSNPYQVVVAVIEKPESLMQAFLHIQQQIKMFSESDFVDRELNGADIVMVPEMFWEIEHRFREFEGKIVANAEPPGPITRAMQTIQFRLDRSGAFLESESRLAIAAMPREFVFNRPFLIYLKKRGAEHPFFVMWVDNAELLTKK
jgi:hypothetical protein